MSKIGSLPPECQSTIRSSEGLVLVELWHPRCSPCRAVQEWIRQLDHGTSSLLHVARINVHEQPDVADALDIEQIPTLLVFRDGAPAAQLTGADAIQEFTERVKASLGLH